MQMRVVRLDISLMLAVARFGTVCAQLRIDAPIALVTVRMVHLLARICMLAPSARSALLPSHI